MRIALSARRSFRLFLAVVSLLAAGITAHAQTTTFSGTVYSPLGQSAGDPIPNILVFVEDPNNPAPTFTKGLVLDSNGAPGNCAEQAQKNPLVPISVLGSAITKYDGTFSFNVAGALPNPTRLFIQAGKWRSVQTLATNTINVGGNNSYTLSMPSQAVTGVSDLPDIAVVTGTADDIECIFPQIGIAGSEITDPSGTGHINLFLGNGSGGHIISGSTPSETSLVSSPSTLANYDLVVFGCQGPSGRTDADANTLAYNNNIRDFANSGGRIFATHWEIPWIQEEPDWTNLASFSTSTSTSSDTEPGQLSTLYVGEPIIAAWLKYIGALSSQNPPEVSLTAVFYENITGVNAPAQTWITLPQHSNLPDQFSFDTPIGATGTPAVSLNFTNTTNVPNEFLTGDPDDVVTITATNTSTANTTSGLTLTLAIPSVVNVLSVADSSGGAWSCTYTAPNATCTLASPLAAGASDSVAVSFSIPNNTNILGTYSLSGVLSNGGLNQTSQCGRVLYNDYHVEKAVTARTTFSASACGSGNLTNAQKFLEYSLYNLSSFVAPNTSDTIQIQASSTFTWTVPAPLYYGINAADIETATVNTPGNTTYTYSPSSPSELNPGDYTFNASFTPTDSTDYLSSTSTQKVSVLVDPTTANLTNVFNVYYGQEIGYNALTGDNTVFGVTLNSPIPNLSAAETSAVQTEFASAGTLTVTINGTIVCTDIEGTGIVGASPSNPTQCPDPPFEGYHAATYTMGVNYTGTSHFASSNTSAPTIVLPDPTATTLTSTGGGATTFGTNVTYTATVADIYTTAVGNITFYDSSTAVTGGAGTAPSGATAIYTTATTTGTATFSSPLLQVGTHNIFACFTAPLNLYGQESDFNPSCTSSQVQVISPIPVLPEGTATLLRTSANPSPFGNALTLTANINSTGAFTVIPTGTATFYDNGVQIGIATLDAAGVAVLNTSTLAVGTHPITVTYSGSTSMSASTSAILSQVIVNPGTATSTGFILRVNPLTVPVFVGSTGTATVQVIALTDFNQPVALTCGGLPAQAACTFAQTTIPSGGGTTTLILSAGSPHNCGSSGQYFASIPSRGTLALISLSTLTLCFARRRRKLQGIALAVLFCCLPMALAGCGSGNCTDFAVKPGDYNFTITATPTGTAGSTTYAAQTQAMVMHATLQ